MSWRKGKINMPDYGKQNLEAYRRIRLKSKGVSPAKERLKPEWNDLKTDLSVHQTSRQDRLERKLARVSKNSLEAKQQWREKQHKLKHNIADEETENTYYMANQSARDSSLRKHQFHLQHSQRRSRNTSGNNSMLRHTEPSEVLRHTDTSVLVNNVPKKPPVCRTNNFLGEIEKTLHSTQEFIKSIEKRGSCAREPEETQETTQKTTQAIEQTPQPVQFENLDKIEDMIKYMESNFLSAHKTEERQVELDAFFQESQREEKEEGLQISFSISDKSRKDPEPPVIQHLDLQDLDNTPSTLLCRADIQPSRYLPPAAQVLEPKSPGVSPFKYSFINETKQTIPEEKGLDLSTYQQEMRREYEQYEREQQSTKQLFREDIGKQPALDSSSDGEDLLMLSRIKDLMDTTKRELDILDQADQSQIRIPPSEYSLDQSKFMQCLQEDESPMQLTIQPIYQELPFSGTKQAYPGRL